MRGTIPRYFYEDISDFKTTHLALGLSNALLSERQPTFTSVGIGFPATVSLWPANGASSASMALSTSEVAGASGAIGMPGVAVQTNAAAEVHPHDWHLPESVLDAGPLTLTVAITMACVAVR